VIFESYWRDTAPIAQIPSPALHEAPLRVDVVVVGGGYTGLSAARTLARSGASVVLFERGEIGSGASSRNAGQVLTGLRLDAATLVRRYGESRARELFDVSRAAMDGLQRLVRDESIDCDLERTGHLQAAWKRKHFDEFKDEQALLARVFDHHVHLIPPGEQRAELGSDRYQGLLLDEASMALHPARYVQGLAAAAARAGATLIADCAVTGIERAGARWMVSTASGRVDAERVLIATNGYTTSLTPALQRRLVPIGSYIIVTEPLAGEVARRLLPRGRMAFDTKYFLYYFRVTRDHRLLFGGRAQFSAVTPERTRHAAGILGRAMTEVFPELSATRIDYAWSGNVAFTRDEMPHAGQLDGLFYAAGYCGHGVAMATLLGELVARRISGEPLRHPFLEGEFKAVPLYSGNPWFLPAVGAYYRFKDW